MPERQTVTYIVMADARALLLRARVDPEDLVQRYLAGDLGVPTRLTMLLNAQMASPTERIGRYELGAYGVVIIRRRRSGMVSVMDGSSVLSGPSGPGLRGHS